MDFIDNDICQPITGLILPISSKSNFSLEYPNLNMTPDTHSTVNNTNETIVNFTLPIFPTLNDPVKFFNITYLSDIWKNAIDSIQVSNEIGLKYKMGKGIIAHSYIIEKAFNDVHPQNYHVSKLVATITTQVFNLAIESLKTICNNEKEPRWALKMASSNSISKWHLDQRGDIGYRVIIALKGPATLFCSSDNKEKCKSPKEGISIFNASNNQGVAFNQNYALHDTPLHNESRVALIVTSPC